MISKGRRCRSQWSRGLRRRSASARMLRLWVRILPGAWMSVCSECCVLSGRGLCDELITRPEESYRLWCVVVCDIGTSIMRRPWPIVGCRSSNKRTKVGGKGHPMTFLGWQRGVAEAYVQPLCNLAVDVSCEHHAPAPIVKEAGVGLGARLDRTENLASTAIRTPDCPAHSGS